ncbi:MAG TPA: MBOAT family O-acyltransferase [Caulifigura sp.]|nr:MBOAT family O-acyltransferase [Caulifigura sp.]
MPSLPWPGVVFARLGMSLAVAWAIVLAFRAIQSASGRVRGTLTGAAVLGLALAPVLVPEGFPGARSLAVFVCFDAIFRIIDVTRRAGEDPAIRCGLVNDLKFFNPFPVLLVTAEERAASERVTSPIAPAVARSVVGLILFLLAWGALFRMQQSAVLRSSFVLDHVVKTALFAVTLEIIGLLAAGLERLAGFDPPRLMNGILLARTPAEFWLRYNTRVHMWLVRNVFRRVGAGRHPVRAVVIVFFVSAVLHEAAFDIALSRVDGYQFVFFMLQIPAVLVSPALERSAKRGVAAQVLAHALTVVWFAVTTVFFFRGIGEIFPFFYSAPLPGPLFGQWRF